MSDLDALYRAILDRAADDTPRLVYADALDDLGDPDRAAFIRLQVEAARADPWDPGAVRCRCFRGDAPHGHWVGALPELPDGLEWAIPPFRRGFPAAVVADTPAAFVSAAEKLFDVAPVESLELKATPANEVPGLAATPGLARLKRLVVRAGLGQGIARTLLNSEHLAGLDELVIGAGLTTSATARWVVRSRAFQRLRAFSYRDEQRGGALVATLAGLQTAPPLRSLDLSGNHMTGYDLAQLGRSQVAAGLEALDLSDNGLGPSGVGGLTGGAFPTLRSLTAMRTYPGPEGVRRLADARFTPHLRLLNLGGNTLRPELANDLAALPLRSLRVLDIRDNQLRDAGVERLLRAGWLAGLIHLDLAENDIGERGATALVESPALDGVVALDLGGNPLTPGVCAALRARFGNRVLL